MFCLVGVFVCCCQVILMSPCVAEEIVFYSAIHRTPPELMSIYEQRADKDMIEHLVCMYTRLCICNIVYNSRIVFYRQSTLLLVQKIARMIRVYPNIFICRWRKILRPRVEI